MTMTHHDSHEFKKSYRVYAVVGAACANSVFRRRLFESFDAKSADKLRHEVNRFLSMAGDPKPAVTDDELAMIWAFVCPRTLSQALVPPLSVKWNPPPPTTMSFEVACNSFSDQVCPHWPCDDFS
jgi:hypothetical protein